jgi:hypothetical protein
MPYSKSGRLPFKLSMIGSAQLPDRESDTLTIFLEMKLALLDSFQYFRSSWWSAVRRVMIYERWLVGVSPVSPAK